jgi:hypothetical protein
MLNDECRMQNKDAETPPRAWGRSCFGFLISFCILHSAFCISPAFAQVKGEVESIGFENYYRPECWTQMVVRLTPESEGAVDYLLSVHQQDMDRDQVVYTRQITLTGADENGNARDQRFRVYFKPEPVDQGLPDANDGTQNLAALQKRLRVELTTTSGKFVAALPITNTIFSLSPFDARLGSKWVLAVTDGRSVPPHAEYDHNLTIGLMENIVMVPIAAKELPEEPLGFDGVDAVLWLDSSPDELTAGGDERLRALQNYVRSGGRLVVLQQTDQWQKTLGFADLLPVSITGVRTKLDAEPLRSIARGHEHGGGGTLIEPWDYVRGPMTLGVASTKPGAFVDAWIKWPDVPSTPYIARGNYGCGCVTWVAQDLGDRSLASTMIEGERAETIHWPVIWNRVFGWHDDPLLADRVSDVQRSAYTESTQTVDLGRELNDKTMELDNKSLWLVSVAVVFFIIYWIIAGPGSYFFLLARGKTEASWFVFGATAIAFALLTVLLVDVVVRGAPDLRHFSVVRVSPAQGGSPTLAHVHSRMGLYIPRDGLQAIEIDDAAPGTAAVLGPYGIPPKDLDQNAPNDIGPEYAVPLPDATSGEPTVVHVPYRRTLKKLDASWTGDLTATGLSGPIEGQATLVDGARLSGKLTNGTGKTLRDIYFAYRWHTPGGEQDVRNADYLVYIPNWPAGSTLDLATDLRYETDRSGKTSAVQVVAPESANPDNGHKCWGIIQNQWQRYWMQMVAGNVAGDPTMQLHHALIVLSLFDTLVPNRREDAGGDRLDLLRLGARQLDCSAALNSGSLVIIAGGDPATPAEIPLPLKVNGDKTSGDGERLYQFIVPMDNTFESTPTTQPSAS